MKNETLINWRTFHATIQHNVDVTSVELIPIRAQNIPTLWYRDLDLWSWSWARIRIIPRTSSLFVDPTIYYPSRRIHRELRTTFSVISLRSVHITGLYWVIYRSHTNVRPNKRTASHHLPGVSGNSDQGVTQRKQIQKSQCTPAYARSYCATLINVARLWVKTMLV